MAIETEKKYRLTKEQYKRIFDDLNELNAEFIGEDFEVNELYGGGILDDEKALLRVRKINEKTILTYKKHIRNDFGIKQHTEHETEVANLEAIENIIRCLGFEMGMLYEKRRKKFLLQKVEVVLDELPFGLFLEIEGKLTDIAMIEMLLEMDDFAVEINPYPKLTFHFGVKKNGVIEARFP